jgi:hypothetical protein
VKRYSECDLPVKIRLSLFPGFARSSDPHAGLPGDLGPKGFRARFVNGKAGATLRVK